MGGESIAAIVGTIVIVVSAIVTVVWTISNRPPYKYVDDKEKEMSAKVEELKKHCAETYVRKDLHSLEYGQFQKELKMCNAKLDILIGSLKLPDIKKDDNDAT